MVAPLIEHGPVIDPPEFRSTYTTSTDYDHEVSQQLLASLNRRIDGQFVCFQLDGVEDTSNVGRKVEEVVFMDKFRNTPEDMEKGYGAYESASRFFLVIDQANIRPAGVLRVIENSPNGLKTLNDIADPEALDLKPEEVLQAHAVDDINKLWDVGTVAVLPEYRGTASNFAVSMMAYRALYASAIKEGIEHFVSVVDQRAHKDLKLLGIPFVSVMGSTDFSYMGSEKSTALYGHVPSFVPAMETYRQTLLAGDGIKARLLAPLVGSLITGEGIDQALAF